MAKDEIVLLKDYHPDQSDTAIKVWEKVASTMFHTGTDDKRFPPLCKTITITMTLDYPDDSGKEPF